MKIFTVALLFITASVANAEQASIFLRLRPPLVAAHQGGYPWQSGNNTLPKFMQAIEHKADIIETDLRLTKDNIVVVFHDDILDDDTECSGALRDKTYAELLQCPYLRTGTPIEKYENLLKIVNGRVIINAEFKVQEVVVPAIKLVQKYNAYNWTYFQTKAERSRYFLARQTDPKVALLYKTLNEAELDWALSLKDPYLLVIEMEADMATPENIKKVAKANKLVTVNSWRYGYFEEFMFSACDDVFELGVSIAVTNNITSCIEQKNSYISP